MTKPWTKDEEDFEEEEQRIIELLKRYGYEPELQRVRSS